MAVSATREGLTPTNFYAAAFIGRIAYHDFEGVTIRPEEGERLVANLGDRRIMMLRNHGTLVMAKSLPQAFLTQWLLQRSEARRVGKAGVSPCQSLWSPYH